MTNNQVSIARIEQTVRSHRSSLLAQQRAFAANPSPGLEESIAGLEKEIGKLESLVKEKRGQGQHG